MKLRQTHTPAIAGAKAGFSTATAYSLAHHATIFELHVESYRRGAAIARKQDPGSLAVRATTKGIA